MQLTLSVDGNSPRATQEEQDGQWEDGINPPPADVPDDDASWQDEDTNGKSDDEWEVLDEETLQDLEKESSPEGGAGDNSNEPLEPSAGSAEGSNAAPERELNLTAMVEEERKAAILRMQSRVQEENERQRQMKEAEEATMKYFQNLALEKEKKLLEEARQQKEMGDEMIRKLQEDESEREQMLKLEEEQSRKLAAQIAEEEEFKRVQFLCQQAEENERLARELVEEERRKEEEMRLNIERSEQLARQILEEEERMLQEEEEERRRSDRQTASRDEQESLI